MTDEQVAIKHFEDTWKALYELVGMFVVGPLKGHMRDKAVRQAISALAQVAKDRPGGGMCEP